MEELRQMAIGGKNPELKVIDPCSLCNCFQFSSECRENPHGYSQLYESHSDSDSGVLKVFLADNDERALNLQLCTSCQSQCEQLLRAAHQVSLLIAHITTLLLQNSRFTLIHPKHTIIQKLFTDSSFQHLGLEQLDRCGTQIVYVRPPQTGETLKSPTGDDQLDREIEELETQFHLDRIKGYLHESGTHSENENESDRESTSSSLYSFLPNLTSFDSSSSAQKDPLGNNIMNVSISALESSGSGPEQLTPPKRRKTFKSTSSSSPKIAVTSIANLIANTTNDELDVCLSNNIQKMRRERVPEEKIDVGVGRIKGGKVINIFRLPLPPNMSPPMPLRKAASKSTGVMRGTSKKNKGSPSKEEQKSKKRLTCSMCPKTWRTKKDLNMHMGSHLKISNFVCDICGMAYRHKAGLESHVALHRGDAKYKCEHCQKQFTQKSGLERHQEAIHKKSRNYVCPEAGCGRTFRYHSSFNLHKQSHQEIPDKKFKCPLKSCTLSFFTSYHLRRHQKTHTGDKQHMCPACGKTFREKYNLDTHSKIHQKDKPPPIPAHLGVKLELN